MTKAVETVAKEFYDLLVAADTVFESLRDANQRGASGYATAFRLYGDVWKYQQKHRNNLLSAAGYGLTRAEIGAIASRIGQIYQHYALSTGDRVHLERALSFYEAIETRKYYRTQAAKSQIERNYKRLVLTRFLLCREITSSACGKAKIKSLSPCNRGCTRFWELHNVKRNMSTYIFAVISQAAVDRPLLHQSSASLSFLRTGFAFETDSKKLCVGFPSLTAFLLCQGVDCDGDQDSGVISTVFVDQVDTPESLLRTVQHAMDLFLDSERDLLVLVAVCTFSISTELTDSLAQSNLIILYCRGVDGDVALDYAKWIHTPFLTVERDNSVDEDGFNLVWGWYHNSKREAQRTLQAAALSNEGTPLLIANPMVVTLVVHHAMASVRNAAFEASIVSQVGDISALVPSLTVWERYLHEMSLQ
eukprot:Clim_evm2s246 gene=Clim_evmTU2s246